MLRIAGILVRTLVLAGTLAAGGCVVVPRRPPPPPPPGCWWVAGHYDAHGYWVRGHCRR
mgnify:CR=1 FL=1